MTTERVAFITGGNRGIGFAIAEELIETGYRVAVTSRSGEGGPAGAFTVAADVTDQASVDTAFARVEQELGPVAIVVSNAGITDDGLVLRMSDASFERVVDTNLNGGFRVAKRALKGMIRARHGRIVFISSIVGLYGSPGQTNYAASKAGLVGLARSLTREIGSRGITANVVTPGYIETDMTAALPEALRNEYLGLIPAGRYGTAADIARTVRWLVGEDAAYISGAVIPVDGGLGMGH